jgi:hypothetical protein
MQSLTTGAFDHAPDVVVMMFGTNDAMEGTPLASYKSALLAAAALCRKNGVDLVIAGPPLLVEGDGRYSLPLTRPYSAVAEEAAAEVKALFVDAGAALARVSIDDPAASPSALYDEFFRGVQKLYISSGAVDRFHPNDDGQLAIGLAAWNALLGRQPAEPMEPTGSLTLPATPRDNATVEMTLRRPNSKSASSPATGKSGESQPEDESATPEEEPADAPTERKPDGKNVPATPQSGAAQPDNPAAAPQASPGKADAVPSKPAAPPPAVGAGEQAVSGASISLLQVDRVWKPAQENSIAVKDFLQRRTLRLPFLMAAPPGYMALRGSQVQYSFVLHHDGISRLVDLKGPVLPIAVEIPTGRQENVAGDLMIDCQVYNYSANPFQGTAEIRWQGQQFALDLSVEPNGAKPLRLRLNLPADTAGQSVHGRLDITVKSGEAAYHFEREIEATPNIPLGQRVAMQRVSQSATGGSAAEFPGLTARADAKGLYLTMDLPPISAQPGKSVPAAAAFFAIDARGPEDRGTTGFVEAVALEVPWQDGPLAVKRVRPAIFGNGYDREIDPANFRASVKTAPNGRRTLQFDIPRWYLYLHQWSLADSGQNTLGINAGVTLAGISADKPEAVLSPENSWELTHSALPKSDAQSLAVLELRSRSSGAWSVRLY